MGMTACFRRAAAVDLPGIEANPGAAAELLFEPTDAGARGPVQVDIDKMWNGLHWLLAGDTENTDGLGAVVLGGEEVGEDCGYGPARLHRPDEVARLSAELNVVTEDQLRARWNPEQMLADDVYPSIWDEGDAVFEEELLPAFRQVRALFAEAADAGEGVLVGIA